MPGLLRGVARTAVVAGTASAVSGRVARRQAEKFAGRDQAIAANRGAGYAQGVQHAYAEPVPTSAPPADDPIARLRELAELRDQGILTEEEFAAQKAKILGA
ncbi:MAG: SHOCT domain-containing protein [Acidimicrobiia bacterium]|nr:SHOCT domain-containing protein [Acidimicrobiia bacterium]